MQPGISRNFRGDYTLTCQDFATCTLNYLAVEIRDIFQQDRVSFRVGEIESQEYELRV